MFSALKGMLCMILSFLMGFFTFPASFFGCSADTDYQIPVGDFSENTVMLCGEETAISIDGNFETDANGFISTAEKITINFSDAFCDWFNYYGLVYSADGAVKGYITYQTGVTTTGEEFFLEKTDGFAEFYSFIDGYFKNVKGNKLISISFEPLENDNMNISIAGISVFNREVADEEVYIENTSLKLGVNLVWGGALSYLEDLNSNVQAVQIDGKTYVDSNAGERYSANSVNNNVNLINCNDTGRLVQQSYYGTGNSDEYQSAEYSGTLWNYNPVQGGNQYNESSKIVDLRVEDNSIYVKCRPLDWAKSAEYITPSYMEATYSLDGELVYVSCRFVDFSGYTAVTTTQEMPAFYCIEPLNTFVYYNEGKLNVEDSLIFWPDAGYPNFTSDEHWAAFIGQFEDSFGIGLYTPGENNFLAGVFARGNTSSKDPATEGTTSYIALVKAMYFQSYSPIEYDFYLTTGNTKEIRENFSAIN